MLRYLLIVAQALVLLGTLTGGAARAGEATPAAHRIYTGLLNPREHPDDARRAVRPPDWNTFGGQTRFTTLRGFGEKEGRIVGFREELDRYVTGHELGEVIWPWIGTVFASNLDELAEEIRHRELFLFDCWGYVPGSGPGAEGWKQYTVPAATLRMLEEKLGDRWLGMDNGEQDGRYIGGYASQVLPISTDRRRQYVQFQNHFERLCDDLGNRMATLVSLNYGHYFLKEGVYTLIGAETAQGLPNGQVYYAFIRGAGKQYGVPWFGNASVWNRWGWKSYGTPGPDHSPTMGTSLSLLKRLLYTHILYNCVLVGFENGWLEGDELTPIGRIQKFARQWVRENGQPGTMLTPVALLLDFHSGWTFPRHLYTGDVYRVWGNLPYAPGDYLTEGVLDMLYPGYQDSSFYRDERGFLTATPYGDCADCLLSDAEAWLLARYPVLVVAGGLTGGQEIRDKLQAYVEAGGHLVITAGSLARLPGELAGVTVAGPPRRMGAGSRIEGDERSIVEDRPFEICPLRLPASAQVRYRCGDMPAVAEMPFGRGRLTVIASPFGVGADAATTQPIRSETEKPLARPYPLLAHVRAVLDETFRAQCLFEVGEGLSLVTCRRGPGEYRLGVCNNSWSRRAFKITSRCGPIESLRELTLEQSEKTAPGYLPTGMEGRPVETGGAEAIAGGDIRIFDVRVREENVSVIPHVVPPARVRGRVLPLREVTSIKEAILVRPTFFEHFDAVMVDWKYFAQREKKQLARESGWIRRQGLRVIVDMGSGVNLYPDLRLVDNVREDYEASLRVIGDVLEKMTALGACDLLISLHREPENNFTAEQTRDSLQSTIKRVCAEARPRGITVHIRMGLGKPPSTIAAGAEFLRQVNAPNLRLAPSTGVLAAQRATPADPANLPPDKVDLWLVASPGYDAGGKAWTANGRLADSNRPGEIRAFLERASGKTLVLDAVYDTVEDEYRDARQLREMAGAPASQSAPGG